VSHNNIHTERVSSSHNLAGGDNGEVVILVLGSNLLVLLALCQFCVGTAIVEEKRKIGTLFAAKMALPLHLQYNVSVIF